MGSGFRRQRERSSWRKLSLHTWHRPGDPTVYGVLDVDATRAVAYVKRLRESSGVHVTLTHLVGKAAALAIAVRPEVNAVIRRGRAIYLRESIDVFFQVAFDGGEDLSGAKVARADEKSVLEIARELEQRAARIRAHGDRALQKTQSMLQRLPDWLRGPAMKAAEIATYDLGLDLSRLGVPYDQFGSVMVTNVASFGLPMGLAPLVPFSRVPILLTVGKLADRPIAIDGQVVVRPILPVGVTFDHRVLDGFSAGAMASRFLEVMRDPDAMLGAIAPRAPEARADGPTR